MRIAFIVGEFPKLSATFILDQITGAIDQGHEVDIFADRPANDSKLHPNIERYDLLQKTHYFNVPDSFLAKVLSGLTLTVKYFRRESGLIIKSWNKSEFDPDGVFVRPMLPHMASSFLDCSSHDVVHCHFGPNGLRGLMLKQLGVLRGKLVTTFHGYDVSQFTKSYGKHVYQRLFEHGDMCFSISENMRRQLIELGCREDKVIVHRVGINCDIFKFSPRSLAHGETVRCISVCRLVEKKGIEYAIKAVSTLIHKGTNIQYEIIGDGPLFLELKTLVSKLGVSSKIRLLGWKQQDEVIKALESSHILLAPSVTSKTGDQEGIPVAIMEAMAMGMPVISTFHSGIPELIDDEISGFLVPERDVSSLAERLERLASRPEVWQEVGIAGRKKVERDYNLQLLNEKLMELYKN